MKFLLSLGLSFLSGSSFGQPVTNDNIYDRIYGQLCSCLANSGLTDSTSRKEFCYDLVLKNNYEELRKYGVDTVRNKDFKKYFDLYLKRFNDKKAKKEEYPENRYTRDESFIGTLVKEEKVSGGYNITLRAAETNATRVFFSKEPVNKNELKRFVAAEDNIIISYRTLKENGRDKYIVRAIVYIGKEK